MATATLYMLPHRPVRNSFSLRTASRASTVMPIASSSAFSRIAATLSYSSISLGLAEPSAIALRRAIWRVIEPTVIGGTG